MCHDGSNLPTCMPLMSLIMQRPREVYRSRATQTLKTRLGEMRARLHRLTHELNNGVDVIKEHCIKLRADVQLATETLVEYAHELNETMIKEIDT